MEENVENVTEEVTKVNMSSTEQKVDDKNKFRQTNRTKRRNKK